MLKPTFTLLSLVAASIASAIPVEYVEEKHIVQINKRQADVSQLLQLASLAGITALPTDPAALLQLGPVANSLASALPTPSVLNVLLTAAPSGFVSSIVNDESYAASFQSAFSAGSSPSWFNGLPTEVKSYLHTYSGFGGLATAAGAINGVESNAAASATGGSALTGKASSAASGASGTLANSMSSATAGADSAASSASGALTSVSSAEATSGTTTAGTSQASAAPAGTQSSSTPQNGAVRIESFSLGLAGMVGILGMAVVL